MEQTNSNFLGKHKQFRINRKKFAAAFIAFALIVTLIVFWWLKLIGITVTTDALCGLSEHTHTAKCYMSVAVCGYEEETTSADDASGTLPSGEASETTQSVSAHVHTDSCYEEVLWCSLKEHTHSEECYPDVEADIETHDVWEATFSDVILTDSISQNLTAIAKTQIGYTESERNFQYDENGNKRGYTRYGEWYGNPYGNWNAMFVAFCLHYSGVQNEDDYISSGAVEMHRKWTAAELCEKADGSEPKPGDLVFLDIDSDEVTDLVAIVSEITEDGEIKAIIGDSNDVVEEVTLDEGYSVIDYGLAEKLSTIEEETTQQEPVSQEETTTREETTEDTATQDEADLKNEATVIEIYDDPEWEEKVALFESSLDSEARSRLDELSDSDRKTALEISYAISYLPTVDEFFSELDRYYEIGDEEGEIEHIKNTQEKMISAYAHYQPVQHLEEYIVGLPELLELKEIYGSLMPATFTTGTSEAVTFNYINRGWSAVAPIIIYGGNATEKLTTGSNVNQYWNGIVVEYNSDENYYYVAQKYTGGASSSAATVRSLEATTSKGFVLFIWMADSGATAAQQAAAAIANNVIVGDRVSISVDPTTLSSGYKSGGYGTIRFSEKPADPVVDPIIEDIPLSEIQDGDPSDVQVKDAGGRTTSPEGDVEISKSINGTDIENVFDITLTVRTETNVQSYLAEPDMAVVVVMDISNTMNDKYPDNQTVTSRYDAAVEAAENFINQFAEETDGLSKVGFVAFNTNARKIFELSPCGNASQAAALISEMKRETDDIISNYVTDDRTRFTNVEAGLQMGYDMLADSNNANKYIVFLSDGFPTTYYNPNNVNNSSDIYYGYETYTSSGTKGADGVFYDYVTGYYCQYGTSYSDKASIRAREAATKIKSLGAKIFSIGIDVGGQTIAGFDGRVGLSVIDRTSTTYEIGDASSTSAYQNWLRNSIGSGYYYDSTAKDDIKNAFTDIFTEIKNLNKESRYTIWTSTDPLPVFDEGSAIVEFIHFYDLDDNPAVQLYGDKNGEGLENNARHSNGTIFWDLKYSGYTTDQQVVGDTTTTYYYYSITYRVRLYNEKESFIEAPESYATNGEAYLEYKTIVDTNGVKDTSELKVLEFEKPVVEGYYESFSFIKSSDLGDPLPGAQFTLTHDDSACSVCHGNGKPITTVSTIGPFVSQADGTVDFGNIPSGHIYTLEETLVPNGFTKSGSTFSVQVAYDELTVTETKPDGTRKVWLAEEDYVIKNPAEVFLLPETGGTGTLPFTIIGVVLMAFPILYSIIRRKRERRFD